MPFTLSGAPRLMVGLAVLAVVGIAVAATVWWFFVRADNELATSPLAILTPEATATSTQPAATATPAAADEPTTTPASADEPTATPADTLTEEPTVEPAAAHIDDGEVLTIVATHPDVQGATEAAYFAGEELARLSVPSTAKGTTLDVTGQLFLDAGGIHRDHESTISVGLVTLRSDESRRDNRVQDALNTDQFPVASFVATALTGYPAEFPENEEVSMQLTGMMTLHGVEGEVTWDVVATRSGDIMTALATLETRYEDWGVSVLNFGGFVSVEEDVTLQIQIIAQVS